jgi:hypothetical protein
VEPFYFLIRGSGGTFGGSTRERGPTDQALGKQLIILPKVGNIKGVETFGSRYVKPQISVISLMIYCLPVQKSQYTGFHKYSNQLKSTIYAFPHNQVKINLNTQCTLQSNYHENSTKNDNYKRW